MKIKFIPILSIFLFFFGSCAPSRFVEPLKKKELSVGASFGGPALDYGVPVPLPLTSIEIGYGIDTNLTVFGAIHTSAILFGNMQLDAGVTYRILKQKKYIPNISISPSFNFIHNLSKGSTKFWPILDLNSYWNYGQRNNYFYIGVNNYFELSKTMALDQPQSRNWLVNPQIGHVIKGKRENWQFTTEFKLLGPNIDNSYAFIPYASFGKKGAMGIFLGYRWILGKK